MILSNERHSAVLFSTSETILSSTCRTVSFAGAKIALSHQPFSIPHNDFPDWDRRFLSDHLCNEQYYIINAIIPLLYFDVIRSSAIFRRVAAYCPDCVYYCPVLLAIFVVGPNLSTRTHNVDAFIHAFISSFGVSPSHNQHILSKSPANIP